MLNIKKITINKLKKLYQDNLQCRLCIKHGENKSILNKNN
jgi:hypothetical protein